MRSPFTGIIFALELTHDVNSLLPLLIAAVIAHGFTVLVMRRSILTEKVSRRGYHLTREYAIDPLEILFVREVMRTKVVALSDTFSLKDLARSLRRIPGNPEPGYQVQRLYPVVDNDNRLRGIVTRNELNTLIAQDQQDGANEHYELAALLKQNPIVAYPDEPLRGVIYRMADTGFTRFPVVESADSPKLVGMISLHDLLTAMNRNLAEERKRERILRIRTLFPARAQTTTIITKESDPDEASTATKVSDTTTTRS